METKSASIPLKYLIVCADDTLISESERAKLSTKEQDLIKASIYIGKLERLRKIESTANDKNKIWNTKQAICMAASICPEYGISKKRMLAEEAIENIVWTGGQRQNYTNLKDPHDTLTKPKLTSYTPLIKNAEIWGCSHGSFHVGSIYWNGLYGSCWEEDIKKYPRPAIVRGMCLSSYVNILKTAYWKNDTKQKLGYYATADYEVREISWHKTKLLEHAQEQTQSIYTAHAENNPKEYPKRLDDPISRQNLVQFFAKTAHKLNGIPEWLDDYRNRHDIADWLDKNKDMPCIADWLERSPYTRQYGTVLQVPLYDIDYLRANPPKTPTATENAQRMKEQFKEKIPLLEEILEMLRKLRNPQVLIQKTKVKFWRTKQGKWVIGIMIAIVERYLSP